MIFTIQVSVVLMLLVVFLQDWWFRAVHWILFPLLSIAFLFLQLLGHRPVDEVLRNFFTDLVFIGLVFAILSLYLYFRAGKWINMTKEAVGWADILFLVAVATYLSLLNFLLFFIVSLVLTLFLWLVYKGLSGSKSKQIPQAGFQSLFFIVFLAGDWWWFHMNLNDDYWLLSHLTQWIQVNG